MNFFFCKSYMFEWRIVPSHTVFMYMYSILTTFIIWLPLRVGKMKQILCSDWLSERTRCIHVSCPLRIAHFVAAKVKFFGVIFWPYNKSFIDQACSVKMAGYWPHSFLHTVHCRNAKENLADHPAILTSRLINNTYVHVHVSQIH